MDRNDTGESPADDTPPPARNMLRHGLALQVMRIFSGAGAVENHDGRNTDPEPGDAPLAWSDDPVQDVWREWNEGQRPSFDRIRSAFADAADDGVSVGAALLKTRLR